MYVFFFHEQDLYQIFFWWCAGLIPNWFKFCKNYSFSIKKDMCLVSLNLFWYPLIFGSLANSGLVFSPFYVQWNILHPFLPFHHRPTHAIPTSFQHLHYLYWLFFWSNDSPVSTSLNFKNSLVSSHIMLSLLFFHTQERLIFNRIKKAWFYFYFSKSFCLLTLGLTSEIISFVMY